MGTINMSDLDNVLITDSVDEALTHVTNGVERLEAQSQQLKP